MATDPKDGGVVIRICRSRAGEWDVLDGKDQHHTFDSREDACEYANSLVAGRSGPSAVVLQEGTGE